jgi:hypothetical protein
VLALLVALVMFPGPERDFWDKALPDWRLGLALLVSAWVLILWLHGGYRPRARWSIKSDARLIARATVVLAVATFAYLYLARLPEVSRSYLLVFFAMLLCRDDPDPGGPATIRRAPATIIGATSSSRHGLRSRELARRSRTTRALLERHRVPRRRSHRPLAAARADRGPLEVMHGLVGEVAICLTRKTELISRSRHMQSEASSFVCPCRAGLSIATARRELAGPSCRCCRPNAVALVAKRIIDVTAAAAE